jgi:diaminohydroxyphosphoribosylaminopyrimidine deaminase/5-amino-6-(5-phosphoribosylamino)uracil reductase
LKNPQDEVWMRQALFEAEKGAYATWPNPWVGCLVVKAGRVLGRGYHARAGMAHAEISALRQAGKDAKGATLYVSLEPCNHQGKTPPCTRAILQAGIKRVVAACRDPHPAAKGGLAWLRARGVQTFQGVLERDASRLIRHFLFSASHGRPWMTLKAGMTLDGKIATASGESKWITGTNARADARLLRGECDGILVGAGTLRRDDPGLLPQGNSDFIPWRFILDPKGQAQGGEKVFNDRYRSRTFWLAGPGVPAARRKAIASKGAQVQVFDSRDLEGMLNQVLAWMDGLPIRRLLVEGGSRVLGACLRLRLGQEAVFYISPRLMGGLASLPVFGGEGPAALEGIAALKELELSKIGEDFKLRADL